MAIDVKQVLLGIVIFLCIFTTYYFSPKQQSAIVDMDYTKIPFVPFNTSNPDGWISASLYKELQSYIKERNELLRDIVKPISFKDGNITTAPLNYDYIQRIEQNSSTINYPYSKYECSNTSNTDFENAGEYCILSNIYYNSVADEYYFYQDPSQVDRMKPRTKFMAPHHEQHINIVTNLTLSQQLPLAAILTRPVFVASPPDLNYAHGFLETLGPRFWVLAECQYHASYINPRTIQIYLTSRFLKDHEPNWAFYQRQPDGTYKCTRDWEHMIQTMTSIYPLLIYNSFNDANVMFKHMIFPGFKLSRSASWGYNYLYRKFQSYPLPTQHYRRAYLAYSEWVLNNFHLPSKFELTASEKKLQESQRSECIPIYSTTCPVDERQQQQSSKTDKAQEEYTGEWIVVLNRAGSGSREITNADDLVQALLKVFPDHSNPYLRVWPKQFNFQHDLYGTVRMARSIRILIGVHGAGLSNAMFMRPGTVLFEINPYGCRDLSFNFRRWAEAFNIQHALWIPSVGEGGIQNEACNREGRTTFAVQEVVDELLNVFKNELAYRNGYIKRALDIMTDLSIVDSPPKGYENVLA